MAVVFHPDHEQRLADVHDESLSGLGLYFSDVNGFDVGQEVEILYDHDYFQARVRHVEPHADGEFIVGFACQRIEKP